jgi:hypothetical protein
MPIRNFISRKSVLADVGTPSDPGLPSDVVDPDLGDEEAETTLDGSPADTLQYDESTNSSSDSTEVADEALRDLLIAYFNLVEAPTDEQVHSLAASIGISPEDLEAYVFNMVHEMTESEDDSDDSDDGDEEEDDELYRNESSSEGNLDDDETLLID